MKKLLYIALGSVIILGACKKGKYPDFEQTETGLYYRFHTQNADAPKPKEGDVITLNVVYKNSKDSVIFDSRQRGGGVALLLNKPAFSGALEEGLVMMGVGDSASFYVNADSLFEKSFKTNIPPFIEPHSDILFIVKMEKIQNKEEVEKERAAMMEKQKVEMEKARGEEEGKRNQFLSAKNITAKPTASGLFYIEKVKGKGKQAAKGSTVSVHYTGTLLDGTKFDSSVDRGQPIEFQLGTGQVIPGWDEGLTLMKEGGKATFVIPSNLAYGEMGSGPIPPYSTIVFEVELLKVK